MYVSIHKPNTILVHYNFYWNVHIPTLPQFVYACVYIVVCLFAHSFVRSFCFIGKHCNKGDRSSECSYNVVQKSFWLIPWMSANKRLKMVTVIHQNQKNVRKTKLLKSFHFAL